MRKQIQEVRDAWYEKCAKSPEVLSMPKEISDILQNLASKEDIERFAVRNARCSGIIGRRYAIFS